MYGDLVPVEDALVVASSGPFTASTNTEADGSFQLSVPPGTYDVSASASPPASNINPSIIEGYVHQSAQDMIPVAGVNVTAEPRRVGYDFGGSAMTNSNGFFNLTVRPYYGTLQSPPISTVVIEGGASLADFTLTPTGPGENTPDAYVFDIRFSHPQYATVVQSYSITPGTLLNLTAYLVATQQATITGTVRGTDFYGNSLPLEDALVVASGPEVSSARTNADGSFQLSVTPGTYDVTASASPPASNVNPSRIQGHVYQSMQNVVPVAEVDVTAEPRRVGYDYGSSTITDSNGFFNLTVRPYYYFQSGSNTVTVTEGSAVSMDFLLMGSGGDLSEPCVFDVWFSYPMYPTAVRAVQLSPGQGYEFEDVFLITQVASEDLVMQVASNSSVSGLAFDSERGLLDFVVSGPSGSLGFFNVTVARTLLHGRPIVLVDGVEHSATVTEDAGFWYVYATYAHSEHQVIVGGSETVPEFPGSLSWVLLLVTLMISMALRVHKRISRRGIRTSTMMSKA
jgi:hypothetical protein